MSNLRDLYQEVILDHTKHPRNKGILASANRHADGFNPLCGDKVQIFVDVENGIVKDIRFDGSGCAISTASASMLTEHLKGKSEKEVGVLFERFHNLVTGEKKLSDDTPDLGKLIVFEGVREFPMRVKCATLSWHTLMAALKNEKKEVTTED